MSRRLELTAKVRATVRATYAESRETISVDHPEGALPEALAAETDPGDENPGGLGVRQSRCRQVHVHVYEPTAGQDVIRLGRLPECSRKTECDAPEHTYVH